MGIDILGLKSKDEARLKHMLKELAELNDSLSSKYSLRADLRDLTNRSFTVGKLLQEELDKIKSNQQKLEEACNETLRVKNKIEACLGTISEIESKLELDDNGISIYDRIVELTSAESIEEIENSKQEILDKYNELFSEDEQGESTVDQLSSKVKEIKEKYAELFEEQNKDGENLFEEMESRVNKLGELWKEYFVEDEEGVTKSELIDGRLKKLDQFYIRIYGDEAKDIPSLKKELEERLDNLKDVETRAKATIDLSSEAGLAGGFVSKRKEANTARLISLAVFIVTVLCMFGFNLWLFDADDFKNMELHTLLFKITINAPLIWIATIANINLNRFSRLEQEYSHKESLAKSYERYRAEIEQLEQLGVQGADDLKIKLLDTNLEAFKLNPVSHTKQEGKSFALFNFGRKINDT
ncbi:hypothetical protein PFCIP103579_0026 [Prolinoborus fasciculus]|jgi:hypothetical protein|uniref:hypothetical protein n=1 Tax=Acinetobacter TaxID=469 RepID=UPI000D6093AC|nr:MULTISPECIES: hypothetical protein [Pseudomonadota]MCO8084485.1 hypothetical protein [Acinetobacter lwoffii]MCO8094892.1 hypothetical protein [Acinetobacter lwoffii]SPJ18882.1 hypothetical protein PFCIP103579_0026 [Prolinoborus fasciculus]